MITATRTTMRTAKIAITMTTITHPTRTPITRMAGSVRKHVKSQS